MRWLPRLLSIGYLLGPRPLTTREHRDSKCSPLTVIERRVDDHLTLSWERED